MNSYNKGHYSASGEYIADFTPKPTAPYAHGYSFFEGKDCDSMCKGKDGTASAPSKPTFNDPLTTQPATVETFDNKPIKTAQKEVTSKPLSLPPSLKFLQQ